MPPSPGTISVKREDLIELYKRSEAFSELARPRELLRAEIEGPKEQPVLLDKNKSRAFKLLESGLLFRAGQKPKTTSSYRPSFLVNPDWTQRFALEDRHKVSELIDVHQKGTQYLEQVTAYVRKKGLSSPAELKVLASWLEQARQDLELLYSEPDRTLVTILLDRSRIFLSTLDALGRKLVSAANHDKWKVNIPLLPTRQATFTPWGEPKVFDASGGVHFRVGEVIEALVNHSLPGLDEDIRVREHQIERQLALRADYARSREFGVDRERTIVGPTGSGKTRDMITAIAVYDAEWGLKFDKGNKVLFGINLKTGKQQIEAEIMTVYGEAFRNKYGRYPVVTFIESGGRRDFSGDFVIVMIPTFTHPSNADKIVSELHQSLKPGATVPMLMLDEVHHGDSFSYNLTRDILRDINPDLEVTGFTGTPVGSEVNVVSQSRTCDLSPTGALPGITVVEEESGISLDTVATGFDGEFQPTTLTKAINVEKRHGVIMKGLEKHGIRARSKSGKEGLAPTLIFGRTLEHVLGIANYYVGHFSAPKTGSSNLQGRNVKLIGGTGIGKEPVPMDYDEVKQAIEDYKAGRIDALVAVVWGKMPGDGTARDVRKLIETEFKNGNIETVVNCKTLYEMYDAPFVRNIVGAAPYLEPQVPFQQVGRFARHGKDEVTNDGVLLKNENRLALFIRDQLTDGRLTRSYTEALGLPFDLKAGRPYNLRNPDPEAVEKRATKIDWKEVLSVFRTILKENYNGDAAAMRRNLGGLTEKELIRRLEKEDIAKAHLILRDLSTLLYVDRKRFDKAYMGSVQATPGYDEFGVMHLLRMGLEYYVKKERPQFEDPNLVATFDVNCSTATRTIVIKQAQLRALYQNTLESGEVNNLALGLYTYFSENGEAEKAKELGTQMDALRSGRLGWAGNLKSLEEMPNEDFHQWLEARLAAAGLIKRKGRPASEFTLYCRVNRYGELLNLDVQRKPGSPSYDTSIVVTKKEGQWVLSKKISAEKSWKSRKVMSALAQSGKIPFDSDLYFDGQLKDADQTVVRELIRNARELLQGYIAEVPPPRLPISRAAVFSDEDATPVMRNLSVDLAGDFMEGLSKFNGNHGYYSQIVLALFNYYRRTERPEKSEKIAAGMDKLSGVRFLWDTTLRGLGETSKEDFIRWAQDQVKDLKNAKGKAYVSARNLSGDSPYCEFKISATPPKENVDMVVVLTKNGKSWAVEAEKHSSQLLANTLSKTLGITPKSKAVTPMQELMERAKDEWKQVKKLTHHLDEKDAFSMEEEPFNLTTYRTLADLMDKGNKEAFDFLIHEAVGGNMMAVSLLVERAVDGNQEAAEFMRFWGAEMLLDFVHRHPIFLSQDLGGELPTYFRKIGAGLVFVGNRHFLENMRARARGSTEAVGIFLYQAARAARMDPQMEATHQEIVKSFVDMSASEFRLVGEVVRLLAAGAHPVIFKALHDGCQIHHFVKKEIVRLSHLKLSRVAGISYEIADEVFDAILTGQPLHPHHPLQEAELSKIEKLRAQAQEEWEQVKRAVVDEASLKAAKHTIFRVAPACAALADQLTESELPQRTLGYLASENIFALDKLLHWSSSYPWMASLLIRLKTRKLVEFLVEKPFIPQFYKWERKIEEKIIAQKWISILARLVEAGNKNLMADLVAVGRENMDAHELIAALEEEARTNKWHTVYEATFDAFLELSSPADVYALGFVMHRLGRKAKHEKVQRVVDRCMHEPAYLEGIARAFKDVDFGSDDEMEGWMRLLQELGKYDPKYAEMGYKFMDGLMERIKQHPDNEHFKASGERLERYRRKTNPPPPLTRTASQQALESYAKQATTDYLELINPDPRKARPAQFKAHAALADLTRKGDVFAKVALFNMVATGDLIAAGHLVDMAFDGNKEIGESLEKHSTLTWDATFRGPFGKLFDYKDEPHTNRIAESWVGMIELGNIQAFQYLIFMSTKASLYPLIDLNGLWAKLLKAAYKNPRTRNTFELIAGLALDIAKDKDPNHVRYILDFLEKEQDPLLVERLRRACHNGEVNAKVTELAPTHPAAEAFLEWREKPRKPGSFGTPKLEIPKKPPSRSRFNPTPPRRSGHNRFALAARNFSATPHLRGR